MVYSFEDHGSPLYPIYEVKGIFIILRHYLLLSIPALQISDELVFWRRNQVSGAVTLDSSG